MFFTGKYRKSFRQRLGFSLPEKTSGSPRFWIHAVSVGEVTAVTSLVKIIRETYPESGIILSTGTETGQEMAKKMIGETADYIYYPLDFPCTVKKMLETVNPDIFISTETELWPNFLRLAKQRGVKTILVNGRISSRSFTRYRKSAFFWKEVLNNLDVMSMISPVHAEKIKTIGALPERVSVTGNSKYDALTSQVNPRFEEEMRKVLNVNTEDQVFVAASTHRGEEQIVLKAYREFLKKFPRLILIIVPRHIERMEEVEKILKEEGFYYYLRRSWLKYGRQRKEEESIIILDTIGELFKVYSLATLVFCGGSFLPRGGQNILEPAAWGKVILYGPSMEDFQEAKELLETVKAGVPLQTLEDLIEAGVKLLSQPEELKTRGKAGRQAILSCQGATLENLKLIKNLLKES